MKIKKCIFAVVMLLVVCACFVLNNSSSLAVTRYEEVYDDESFQNDTYSVGAPYTDSGGIFCEPLRATYYNNKHESSYKEIYYKLYKIQFDTEVVCGNAKKKGTGSPIVTSKLSVGDYEHAYKRYAYGYTHKTSSDSSALAGSAYLTIVKTYPGVESESGVNVFDTDYMELEDTDYTEEENLAEGDGLE